MASRRIMLAMKKRGFGIGKWNGVGGKVEERETIIEAVMRETKEECGLIIRERSLAFRGVLEFIYRDHPSWDNKCFVYTAHEWEGEPQETEGRFTLDAKDVIWVLHLLSLHFQ
ncbi:hydrolase [Planoprotostelium fungivorum]|uniref:Oxidized purine nucleoside triphosphate hydrolase n=1 Tax=Planoprotostelium fungivorum TaxID=1890364 RepID=A0A2P6N7S6_9EUKA|nr:hydrolase [Planoprotostelium fungivorum]